MLVYKLESCSLFGRDYTHRLPKPLKDVCCYRESGNKQQRPWGLPDHLLFLGHVPYKVSHPFSHAGKQPALVFSAFKQSPSCYIVFCYNAFLLIILLFLEVRNEIDLTGRTHCMELIIFTKYIYSATRTENFVVVTASCLLQWICSGQGGYFHCTPKDGRT